MGPALAAAEALHVTGLHACDVVHIFQCIVLISLAKNTAREKSECKSFVNSYLENMYANIYGDGGCLNKGKGSFYTCLGKVVRFVR